MNNQKVQSAYEVAKELYEDIKKDTEYICNNKDVEPIQMINRDKFLAVERFEEMQLGKILQALYDLGHEHPSQVQKLAIPAIKSQNDVVIQSQSGTGKTIAFLVGLLTSIEKGKGTQAVIISPTRELNMQIYDVTLKLTKYNEIETFLALKDKNFDKNHYEIILGTPGSVLSLVNRRLFDFKNLKFFVLDETDVLLDKTTMGTQTFRLLQAFKTAKKVFISATYNDDIKKTIDAYAPDCVKLYQKQNAKPDEIKLYHIDVSYKDKVRTLQSLYELLTVGQVIVFVSKKATVKKLEKILVADSNSVSILHGDLLPEERDFTVEKFKTADTKILVTTDVFSRGMDIPQVNLIINFDLPYYEDKLLLETYIHRIGRSGRFGRTGFVIDMIGGGKEFKDYIQIQEELKTISKGFTIEELQNVNVDE